MKKKHPLSSRRHLVLKRVGLLIGMLIFAYPALRVLSPREIAGTVTLAAFTSFLDVIADIIIF